MTELTLSPAAARALHLAAQGKLQPLRRKATKDDVMAAIRAMGVLQIDTISVAARSPYLVLWGRRADPLRALTRLRRGGGYADDSLRCWCATGSCAGVWGLTRSAGQTPVCAHARHF